MSEETRSAISKWLAYVKKQAAVNNFTPLIITAGGVLLAWYLIVVPFYKEFKEWAAVSMYGATKSTEVSLDVQALQIEIETLKKDLASQKKGRELGKPFELVIRQ